MTRVAVVGAGWSGASCARALHDGGFGVEVFERAKVVGGHSRAEVLDGVVYEPNGAHIFHTSDAVVAAYVQRFGLNRRYGHCVLTEVYLAEDDDRSVLLSWPPQLDELRELPLWPQIERELAALPSEPSGADFATYVISMMGPTLYRLFIEGYTIKQWGRPPSELSSSFAPKRVELRRDGYRRLFRDTWEFFPAQGVNSVIEGVLGAVTVNLESKVTLAALDDLVAFDHVVITAPLDEFAGCDGDLEWRGIRMESTVHETGEPAGTVTPAYVVNRPSMRVPHTRTVETKHATGQLIDATVVSLEFPGAPARHYPVPTVDGRFESRNRELKTEIAATANRPVWFCGRLANYQYINQDEAIRQGLDCAARIAAAAAS